MAEEAVEYAYRYAVGSRLEGDREKTLALATWDGPSQRPRLFRGRVLHPVLLADGLLTIGAVARARFHVPPAMVAHILLLADPVVTAAGDHLRFEAFSSCASAYGCLDLRPGSVDGEFLGAGTTNVDFGAQVRAALASVTDATRLDLEVGSDDVAVEIDGERREERKVALPERWVRGFAEAQAIMAGMTPRFSADGAALRRLLRSLPRGAKRPVYVRSRGGAIEIGHRSSDGDVPVAVTDRLRLLERLAPWATGVHVHAAKDGASAWTLALPDARFTLTISAEAWRGFSGEGRLLDSLARPITRRTEARVGSAVRWRVGVRADALAGELGVPEAETEAALARLAAAGQLGFDPAERAYFARRLPYAPDAADRRQPRLRRARALVDAGSVRLDSRDAGQDGEVIAWVAGRSAEYRVRIGPHGRACTCPWWGRHPGERGPCSHMVAVQLLLSARAGSPAAGRDTEPIP